MGAGGQLPALLQCPRLDVSMPRSLSKHTIFENRTAEPANPLIKEALTFNFTNVALFHKEQREFISNLTPETCFMFLSSGNCIITPQISDYRNFFP